MTGAAPAGRPHPWESRYPAACRWDEPLAIGTLPDLLRTAALRWAEQPAFEYAGMRTSYHRFHAQTERLAAGLRSRGVGPGSRVALLLPNTPWHPVCFFALMRLGAIVVHLSPLDARRELIHKLTDSGARILVTTDLVPAFLEGAGGLLAAGLADTVLVGEDGFWRGRSAATPDAPFVSLSALLDGPDPDPDTVPDPVAGDIALLQYTGGTTGLPKGAMLTHANLTAAVSIYRAWNGANPMEPGVQRVLAVLPLFHIYALVAVLLLALAEGNEILLRPRFDAQATLNDIEAEGVTVLAGVPTIWLALLHCPDAADRKLSSLKACWSAGAPLPAGLGEKVERMLGRPLIGGWGMTETAATGTGVPTGIAARGGLIGVPLPGVELTVLDPGDPTRPAKPGEVGEIAIRGPNVFQGYWNAGAKAGFVGGFLLTGDLGMVEADGTFTLVDRKKRMIVSSGFKVYPAVLEAAIATHPDVREVAVIGVPHPYRGEAPKAFAVLRSGAADLTLPTLHAFLGDHCGPHELPVALEVRPALPQSAAGKVLFRELDEEERRRQASLAGERKE